MDTEGRIFMADWLVFVVDLGYSCSLLWFGLRWGDENIIVRFAYEKVAVLIYSYKVWIFKGTAVS